MAVYYGGFRDIAVAIEGFYWGFHWEAIYSVFSMRCHPGGTSNLTISCPLLDRFRKDFEDKFEQLLKIIKIEASHFGLTSACDERVQDRDYSYFDFSDYFDVF